MTPARPSSAPRGRRRARALSATVVAATAGSLITVTAPAAEAAVTCASPVFKRQFFANTTFSGTPKKTDCDSTIDQNWGTGAPATGLPSNYFGVRWTVTRDFGSGGPFALPVETRDGIRVYVDDVRKVDIWKNVSTTQTKTVNVTIPAGKHTLRIDFVNWTGSANVKFAYTPRTSTTVDTTKPLVPTAPALTYTSSYQAKFSWSANKEMDLAGYRVYRRLKSGSYPAQPLATTTSTSFTDTTVPATGDTYAYEVRAYDKAGNTSAGTADQYVTTADRTGPAAPTGLTAHGDLPGMVIEWKPVTDATAYELYEKSATTGAYTLLKRQSGTSYTHYVAADATRHTYAVRAVDAAGNPSAYSATVTSDGIDRTAPAAPTSLDATVDTSQVWLSWRVPSSMRDELDNDARFVVYRAQGTSLGADRTRIDCQNETTTLDSSSGTYLVQCADRAAALDTAYTYGVAVRDGAGNESAVSDTVTVTTSDRVPPRPVTGLKATPRGDGTLLSWDKPAGGEDIVAHHAQRGVRQADGTVKWQGPYLPCVDGKDDPLAILCIDVPDGETYVYAVTAEDKWGNELRITDPSVPNVTSTELSLEPADAVGSDPGPIAGGGGWRATEDISGAYWRCTDPTPCADITEFRISRWSQETGTYEPLATVPSDGGTTSQYYRDETQPLGETSFYRVIGVRADGTTTAAGHPWTVRPDLV
ncbi:fibronectin type III domain-containing protein [Streptomyces sp. NBC_01361]|uniref:fibronectin type III domain-containing protein n=1 Tax=Streptomyces sp. NBC_01361 TaxID=2903838 RepID=UPI002E3008CA|nr:PA14 domain-containing protein [Streptomyces sp. NBC_01361]